MHECRWLLGESVSEADVRLFPIIFRFDHIYYLRFLLDRAMIVESYPNLQVSPMITLVLRPSDGVPHCMAYHPVWAKAQLQCFSSHAYRSCVVHWAYAYSHVCQDGIHVTQARQANVSGVGCSGG